MWRSSESFHAGSPICGKVSNFEQLHHGCQSYYLRRCGVLLFALPEVVAKQLQACMASRADEERP
jgi:hypothetical protein